MNRTEAYNSLKNLVTSARTSLRKPTIADVKNVIKSWKGISKDEYAGGRQFQDEFEAQLPSDVADQLDKYLDDVEDYHPYIAAENAEVEADQPRLNAAIARGLQPGVPTRNLDGAGYLPEAFKTFVREALESGYAESFDPRFLRPNPLLEDSEAIVGDTKGIGRIIDTGVTNPYGGQESENASTLSYQNCLVTPEKIKWLMNTERKVIVDLGEPDGKNHITEERTLKWDGNLHDTYFEGDNIPAEAVSENGSPWSGHYMLTTAGLLSLPYTRMSDEERVFLTTSSLFHENPTYKVLGVGHFEMTNGKISDFGLSGRMAKGVREGEFKIPDGFLVECLRKLGIPTEDGLQLRFEG